MSYDLAVYTRGTLAADALRDLVAGVAGLAVEEEHETGLTVVRGARRRHCFSVDGPDRVEDEDVPEEVTAVVLGATHLWTVAVEGSAGSEVPPAARFARRLAQALDGAVLDPQTDEVWSRSRGREVRRPQREARVAAVELDWFCLRSDLPTDVPGLVTGLARRHLPEALPRRFGEHEPLQGRWDEAGPDGFAAAWTAATSLLFTAGTVPCLGLTLGAGPGERHPRRFWGMSATLLAEPLADPAWRDALRGFFVGLADGLGACYASAQVTRGHLWSGRSLWSDRETGWGLRPLHGRQDWLGLPEVTPWWTWLGPAYAEGALRALPDELTTATARGVLVESAEQPTAGEELLPLERWLPEGLFARVLPHDPGQRPLPQSAAPVIPGSLQ